MVPVSETVPETDSDAFTDVVLAMAACSFAANSFASIDPPAVAAALLVTGAGTAPPPEDDAELALGVGADAESDADDDGPIGVGAVEAAADGAPVTGAALPVTVLAHPAKPSAATRAGTVNQSMCREGFLV